MYYHARHLSVVSGFSAHSRDDLSLLAVLPSFVLSGIMRIRTVCIIVPPLGITLDEGSLLL